MTERTIPGETSWLLIAVSLPIVGVLWCFAFGRIVPELCSTASAGMLFAVLAVSSWTDATRSKIYNCVTYPAFLWFVSLNLLGTVGLFDRLPWVGAPGIGYSLFGAAACFGISLIPYVFSSGGAGDAKLGAVVGAALGLENGVAGILAGIFLAGLCVIASIIWRQGPWFFLRMNFRRIGHWFFPLWILPPSEEEWGEFRKMVPLAPGFLIGTIFVLSGQLEVLLQWITS